MDIGRTIRNIRVRKGLKAGELARQLGVSKSYISRIERERRRINTDLLEKIGKALDVSPAILFAGTEVADPGEDVKALYILLTEVGELNPRFADRAVRWIAELAYPLEAPFDTASAWESGLLDTAPADAPDLRALLGRFLDLRDDLFPLNPRPNTPYSRFREGALTALRGLSEAQRAGLVTALLPALQRNRARWPARLREIPVFLPKAASAGSDPAPKTLPVLPPDGNGASGPAEIEVLPGEGSEHLRAAVIEDSAMAPKYEPGDVVIYSTSRAARGGERAVVGFNDGRWTCRIYRKRGSLIQLTPLNPLYEPLFLKPEEISWAHPVVRSLSD